MTKTQDLMFERYDSFQLTMLILGVVAHYTYRTLSSGAGSRKLSIAPTVLTLRWECSHDGDDPFLPIHAFAHGLDEVAFCLVCDACKQRQMLVLF